MARNRHAKMRKLSLEKSFGAPKYTANATLRGEMGASLMTSRDMKQKSNYVS